MSVKTESNNVPETYESLSKYRFQESNININTSFEKDNDMIQPIPYDEFKKLGNTFNKSSTHVMNPKLLPDYDHMFLFKNPRP